ncbi:hypothetical protein DSUL_160048 [Desulfovibrionales bacterium]
MFLPVCITSSLSPLWLELASCTMLWTIEYYIVEGLEYNITAGLTPKKGDLVSFSF